VSSPNPNDLVHSAFYRFAPVSDVPSLVDLLRQATTELLGSILVAPEGVNGMVAGTPPAVESFENWLRDQAGFEKTVFKHSECKTVPFGRMKVRRKAEIVPLGIGGVDVNAGMGIDVPPHEWRELIDQEDVVLLDNRNSFEYRLGRFRNAIDPQVENFRDFPEYVLAHLDEWKAKGKRVAMYCTGGIRCEKTSAWMRQFDIEVLQLQGGILNYFLQMPDADKDWQGECFVFDNRIALDTHMQETSTTLEEVYQDEPDAEWRLRRAKQLDGSGS
jgi:UPF0176 protein